MDDQSCCYDKYPASALLLEPRSPFRSQDYSRGAIAFHRHRCKDKCWAQGAHILAGSRSGQDMLTDNNTQPFPAFHSLLLGKKDCS